jgi:hypothetical protein
LLVQTELAQSAGTVQLWPGVQRLQDVAPPQSTPLSLPFRTPSVHVGAWQITLQDSVAQSEPRMQRLPSGQPGQEPPQSISVSEPFNVPSPQDGVTHMLLMQTPLEQSAPAAQPLPTAQLVQEPPPQSVSVSVPFRTPSVQSAA